MRAHGYSLTFMSGDKYKDHVNKFVPHMLRSGIDGLIITSFSLNQDICFCCGTRQNPCCGAGRTQPFTPYSTVYRPAVPPDLRDRGASDKNGASEDRLVTGSPASYTACERKKGYLRALEDYDILLTPIISIAENYANDFGYQAMQKLWNLRNVRLPLFLRTIHYASVL